MHGYRTWVTVVALAVGWFYVLQDQFGRGPYSSSLYPSQADCRDALSRELGQNADVGAPKFVPEPRCVSTVVSDTFPSGVATPIWAFPPSSGAKRKKPKGLSTSPRGQVGPSAVGWFFGVPPVTRSAPVTFSPFYHSKAQCLSALEETQKSELRWNGRRITPEPKCLSTNVPLTVPKGQFLPRWEGPPNS